MNLNPNS